MEFEPVIGIEIHVELKSKTKMFSSAPTSFGQKPNSCAVYYDFAFPGTMPVVNKEAVSYGIKVCKALNMTINHTLYFDRKNYFYPDLPKGYQITQQFDPIGRDGYLLIETKDGEKKVTIEQAHLEEDTAKQLHLNDISLVDFNRCGTPLIEIVSNPDMHSGEEAMKYVEAIREIVTYLEVSDGKMENGSLRCDINISLREKGSKKLGVKTECKNLNTISNIKAAVDYEIARQRELLNKGENITQETRRYDETLKKTVIMRKKTDAIDYKYFREPNIIPIDLDDDFINDAIYSMNKLPYQYKKDFKAIGLSNYEIELLLKDRQVVCYFEDCLALGVKNPSVLVSLISGDIMGYLNKNGKTFKDLNVSKENMVYLVNALEEKKINSKQGKIVLEKMLVENRDSKEIISSLGLQMLSDEKAIEKIVDIVIKENKQVVDDYQRGKDHGLGYLVGQVMKMSKGQANPIIAKKLIIEKIGECPKVNTNH